MAGKQSSRVVMEARSRLAAEWRRAAESWRDEVAGQFKRQFLVPLESSISQYMKSVEDVEDALRKVEDDSRL